jgi:tetratricopeptide (TPR) repeat protein
VKLRRKTVRRVRESLSKVQAAVRDGTPDQEVEEARWAVEEAEDLIAAAAGTPEARDARYHLFRLHELLGDRDGAELVFEAHLNEVAAAEGEQAACDLLLKEGWREQDAKCYHIALKRFSSVLSYGKTGKTAGLAYERIGGVHARLQQRGLAEAAFRKAIAVGADPAVSRACYHYLFLVALSNREYERAERDGQALLALATAKGPKSSDEALFGLLIERRDGAAAAARYYRDLIAKYSPKYSRNARERLAIIEKELEDSVLAPMPDGQ